MLANVLIRNFKAFETLDLELGSPVVFIGPNNSGKTSAMQALALWQHGLARWNEKYGDRPVPKRRPVVTVTRRDLISIPVPSVDALWHQLHLRSVTKDGDSIRRDNVRIEITVTGTEGGKSWECGLEFDYANTDWMYCRPLRVSDGRPPQRMPIPQAALGVRVACLPPMSGLAASESRLDQGAIDVRIGEGRTAEVLRNLCHLVVTADSGDQWERLARSMRDLFGCDLEKPEYIPHRGELEMSYREGGIRFDISSGGRGMHQTLLLLSYMYANPGSVLLLDEPDAHLEILRQRQTYSLLTEVAGQQGSQIIAASHSEVLLNEAGRRDMVIAFIGSPHRIDKSSASSQVLKALRQIGFEDYVQAQQTGWVLYLEDSTDLAILRSVAKRIGHGGAANALSRPFVHYVGNQPKRAEHHFFGIREAVPTLRGVAVLDRSGRHRPSPEHLVLREWTYREIENYLCTRRTLLEFARATARADVPEPLFTEAEVTKRTEAMEASIRTVTSALTALGKASPWGSDIKASDEFLTPLFRAYYRHLELPNLMAKKQFHELAEYIQEDEIADEMREVLDAIAGVASDAQTGIPAPSA